jgi:adenylate cyclase
VGSQILAFPAASAPPPRQAAGQQRHAALAFADIVGYSALMARDDTGTAARWLGLLERVVAPLADANGGKVVQVMGDGVFAEFASVSGALGWAEGLHRDIREATAADAAAGLPPIVLRVAIHAGQVMQSGANLFGDAVNLAARLQDHAEPGGTVISAEAAAACPGLKLRDLGPLELKNIPHPVQAFAVGDPPEDVALPVPRRSRTGRPSIAVLPLRDLGGGSEHFAEGLVEDVVLSLSGLRELDVVSRASTLRWRGRTPDAREVGWALGVRYVLDGTLRRSGGRTRVTAVLSDADTGDTLWAEAANADGDDLFALQDALVARIVAGLAPQVRSTELARALRKRPENFTAYEHLLRGLQLFDQLDHATWAEARAAFQRAIDADGRYAVPVAWAARWHSLSVGQGWSADRRGDEEAAFALAARAVELDPRNALGLATLGHLRSFLRKDPLGALELFERALDACPSHHLAWILSSATMSYLGRGDEAVRRADHGLGLSPLDPHRYQHMFFLALAHYVAGDAETAVRIGTTAARLNPLYTATPKLLAAANASLGHLRQAEAAAAVLREREPDFHLGRYLAERQPFADPTMAERYASDLRRAGL